MDLSLLDNGAREKEKTERGTELIKQLINP